MKYRKVLAAFLAAATVMSMTACGSSSGSAPAADSESTPAATTEAADTAETTESAEPAASGDQVTIKVFSNLPDRTSGQGLVEQTIFDEYMKENPNVTIETEELDDEAYKVKFKAYAAGSAMPDLVSVWGQPGFIDEVIDAGILQELNPDDFADYGFINGSMNGFSKDGKLYGLPRNTDVIGVYYNENMFKENGWDVPKTYDELMTLCGKIKDQGIVPIAMDGADKWPLYILQYDIMQKLDGPEVYDKCIDAISKGDFSDPDFKKSADMLQQAAKDGVFGVGFETTDYGTAQNLFLNGQAAMYYMGSWDMSIANNQDVDEATRAGFRAFSLPVIDGGKGTATDLTAWNGGGYSVTSSAANKEEAIKLLKFMFQPENWTRIAWENGVCMSAQDFSQFATGNETQLQKDFMEMVGNASSLSGTSLGDLGTAEFKTTCEDDVQQMAAGAMSTEDYLKALEAVCKK